MRSTTLLTLCLPLLCAAPACTDDGGGSTSSSGSGTGDGDGDSTGSDGGSGSGSGDGDGDGDTCEGGSETGDPDPDCVAYAECLLEQCIDELHDAYGDGYPESLGGPCGPTTQCQIDCCGDTACIMNCPEYSAECLTALTAYGMCTMTVCQDEAMACNGDIELPGLAH